jgi:polysaccharide export outer membrane protein
MISRFYLAGMILIMWGAPGRVSVLATTNDQAVLTPPLMPTQAAKGATVPTNVTARPNAVPSPDASVFARVLSPNDVIQVKVYQEEDLDKKEIIIDKNGMVMLPLLGQIKIGGMTTEEATRYIQELYGKDYLVNPQVNLIVDKFATRRFAVLGQVQHPGSFEFPPNESVNLLEAIAMSGGYTRLGAPSKVTVRRTENGSPKVYYLDATKMAKDQKKKPFEILPDDIIAVGERIF